MIYLDNAATSFPKAPGVVDATVHFMTEVGANAGRGSHRLAREASHRLFDVRERCAAFLGMAAASLLYIPLKGLKPSLAYGGLGAAALAFTLWLALELRREAGHALSAPPPGA